MAVAKPDFIVEMEEEDESINLLIFGESGAGKTPFAGSARNGLLIASEKGVISAKRRGSTMQVAKVKNWADIIKTKRWLASLKKEDLGEDFWVSLDSGTMAQTLLLRKILREEHKKNPSGRDLDIPQIQDHQKWQNEFKRTIQEFVDLPFNLCVTALPMTISSETDEGDFEENILPQFLGQQGAIAWAIAGMFGAGGRCQLIKDRDTKEVKQRIHFTKRGNYWGRDRYNAMGNYTDNATLDDIFKLVQKSAN